MAKNESHQLSRMRGIALLLGILFIAALAIYRYFQTENGLVFMLDAGASGKYEAVQKDLEARIVKALGRYGVSEDRVEIKNEAPANQGHSLSVIHAETPSDASLIQVNDAISRTVRAAGARVRSCREGKDGTIITMEVGTRRFVTNACIIRKGSEKEREAKGEGRRAVIAVCVDDFGYFDNALVRDFLALDVPLTVSIIPGLKYSEKISREAAVTGKNVLCHLPMEAVKWGKDDSEIPLIRVAMKSPAIEKAIVKALATTPGAAGINNHMGSRATADRRVMEAVLHVCRARGLYFFDSMTTPHSVVRQVARELRVPEASNDLFIDGGSGDTRENMKKLLSIAARRGAAIGIMHVKSESLDDLRWMIDEARKEGIDFVTISDLIVRQGITIAEGGRH